MGKVKESAGRPSLFKPEYCDQLVDHMSGGRSYETFAPKVKVHRDTLYAWEKEFPVWLEAKKIAFDLCLAWWEDQGISGLYSTTEYEDGKPVSSRSMNASLWIFNMKNRFKWRDKQPEEGADVSISLTLADRLAKARSRVGKTEK